MRTTKAHDTTRDTYQSKTYTMYTCMLLSHKKKWISIQIENPKNAIDHDI